MRTLLAVVVCTLLVAAAGCKSEDHHMKSDKSMDRSPTMGAMDVCPHCAGVQHGTADGKCESCGMKLSAVDRNMKSTADADTKAHSAAAQVDACSHCPGVQVATADGKCPVCGAQVAPATSAK
jgi:hypothetical protein